MQDEQVTPIFITEEERNYAALAYPGRHMECWPVIPDLTKRQAASPAPSVTRLVYLGSLPPHTRAGVNYLTKHIFPALKSTIGDAQLHLFGGGTEAYHRPQFSVYGHGFYEGADYPFGGDALYTVPDLLGGGIKIKTGDLLEAEVPFITTPFGHEGYPRSGDPNVLIADMDQWPQVITDYFHRRRADSV